MCATGMKHKIMEFFKVVVVCRQECSIGINRMRELDRIGMSNLSAGRFYQSKMCHQAIELVYE